MLRPTPTLIGMNRALRLGRLLALSVERVDAVQHVERGLAGIDLMRWSSSGAFQNAMMASPMYLSIVPLRSMMALVNGVRKLFISLVRPCGSSL